MLWPLPFTPPAPPFLHNLSSLSSECCALAGCCLAAFVDMRRACYSLLFAREWAPCPPKNKYISPKYTVCVDFGVTHIGGTVQTPHKQSSTPAGMQLHACCVRLCLSVSLGRAKSTRTFKRTVGVRVTVSHMSQHHLGGGGSLFCFLAGCCTVTLTHICQGDSVWRCKTAA